MDEYGRVWMDMTVRSGIDEEWHVFSETGSLLGRAILPPDFDGKAVRDDTLYGIVKDDLNVPSVVGFKVDLSVDDSVDAVSRTM